jgi:hypothetical protein
MRSPAISVQSVYCPCPQVYSSPPRQCRGGFLPRALQAKGTPPSCVSLLCALCAPTSVSSVVKPFSSPLVISPHPTKNGGSSRLRRLLDPNSLSGAFFHLGRLRSFGSLYYLKFDRITLLQRPVTIPGDCRIVYEYIGPIFPAYESVSFRIIEPLNCSLHFVSPLDGDSGGGIPRRAAMSTNCAECIKLECRVKQTLTTFLHPCAYLYGFSIDSKCQGREGYRKKVR